MMIRNIAIAATFAAFTVACGGSTPPPESAEGAEAPAEETLEEAPAEEMTEEAPMDEMTEEAPADEMTEEAPAEEMPVE